MRTISELSKMDGRVYVYLKNSQVRQKFLRDAEAEGFRFGDGVKPGERCETDDIYAVNPDGTINFVGFVGHMAFHHGGTNTGTLLIRIDYARYVSGMDDYMIVK